MAQLLASRGISDKAQLHGESLADLIPFAELKGCQDAANQLADAIVCGTRICVLSDYDADGATSCAVMLVGLRAFGADVEFCVPDRLVHGYGLTPAIAEIAGARTPKPELLLTVDNGISSVAGIERANVLGMQVLVTDHHLPGPALPPACGIVNPNQPGCTFPSKCIAGCGVAFYVMWALHEELKNRGSAAAQAFDIHSLLPYVAIGTVADVVALDLNNRTLVRMGLDLIRQGHCSPGVEALIAISKKSRSRLSTTDIGFGVGPRINAAGRLSDMSLGIECLTTDSVARASELSLELSTLNEQRKDIQAEALGEAVRKLSAQVKPDSWAAVVYDPSWHEGVVGIVAGRLKEELHLPTIVMTRNEHGKVKGSARSIPGFHLKHALDEVARRCPTLMLAYGGHAMAAGMTVADFDLFAQTFEQVVRDLMDPAVRTQVILSDGELPFNELTIAGTRELELAIWGQGFLAPSFDQALTVVRAAGMSENKHSRLTLNDGQTNAQAVAFNLAPELFDTLVHVVWKPSINEYKGESNLQLMVDKLLD